MLENDEDYSVYSHTGIFNKVQKVKDNCRRVDEKYKRYLRETANSECALTREQVHKDLKEVYHLENQCLI